MSKKLPYGKSDDLEWKIEKALEFATNEQDIPMKMYQDLESLHNISQAFITLDIELDDMFGRIGRPEDINKHLDFSRPFLSGGYREIQVAMRQVLIIFEELVEELED